MKGHRSRCIPAAVSIPSAQILGFKYHSLRNETTASRRDSKTGTAEGKGSASSPSNALPQLWFSQGISTPLWKSQENYAGFVHLVIHCLTSSKCASTLKKRRKQQKKEELGSLSWLVEPHWWSQSLTLWICTQGWVKPTFVYTEEHRGPSSGVWVKWVLHWTHSSHFPRSPPLWPRIPELRLLNHICYFVGLILGLAGYLKWWKQTSLH